MYSNEFSPSLSHSLLLRDRQLQAASLHSLSAGQPLRGRRPQAFQATSFIRKRCRDTVGIIPGQCKGQRALLAVHRQRVKVHKTTVKRALPIPLPIQGRQKRREKDGERRAFIWEQTLWHLCKYIVSQITDMDQYFLICKAEAQRVKHKGTVSNKSILKRRPKMFADCLCFAPFHF